MKPGTFLEATAALNLLAAWREDGAQESAVATEPEAGPTPGGR
jgi:hypothetical protein